MNAARIPTTYDLTADDGRWYAHDRAVLVITPCSTRSGDRAPIFRPARVMRVVQGFPHIIARGDDGLATYPTASRVGVTCVWRTRMSGGELMPFDQFVRFVRAHAIAMVAPAPFHWSTRERSPLFDILKSGSPKLADFVGAELLKVFNAAISEAEFDHETRKSLSDAVVWSANTITRMHEQLKTETFK